MVREFGVLADPAHLHGSGGAVAVLGDDDLGDAGGGSAVRVGGFVGLVVFVAVQEHDHVGILLDGTRVTQVGQHGLLVGTGFRTARELCAADDGYHQILCHDLHGAGNLGDLLHAVVHPAVGLHELQVVDDHHAEIRHPAELRLHAGHGDAGGIVDEDIAGGEP